MATERCAKLFLQTVQGGDLNAKQIGDRFGRFGVALVGEFAQLGGHAVLCLPGLQHVGCELLLMLTDGYQQRAITRLGRTFAEVDGFVMKHVLVSRQALQDDAAVLQIGLGQLGLPFQQCGDLSTDKILLVRPELYLPRPVAFTHRSDQQRLQSRPGKLRLQERLASILQLFIACTEGDAAGCHTAVGFSPVSIGR